MHFHHDGATAVPKWMHLAQDTYALAAQENFGQKNPLGSHRLRKIEQRQTLSQERQRLMQDMHDGLGSSLVSALRVVEK